MRVVTRWIFGVILAAAGIAGTEGLADDGPVVVELFTSQGCSSCPPADEMLTRLAARDDVIALAMHVDYWDYIGWKDQFANPQYTKRQRYYARAKNSRTVYTPQMVIGGDDHVIGNRPIDVADLIQAHKARDYPVELSLVRTGDTLTVRASAEAAPRDVQVQLVRYRPAAIVDIKRGENAGRKLTYSNIVTELRTIAVWTGAARLELTEAVEGDLPLVVLVQQPGHGSILAAARLR